MLSEPFFVRALLAGVGIAIVAGPVGCFIVWRRMAYFGESLANAGLMGVAIGLFLGIDTTLGVVASGIAMAALLVSLRSQRALATDTLLGILSHGALAAGLITASLMTWIRFDLAGLLFGDLLTVTSRDVAWVWIGGAAALTLIACLWRGLLALTVHEELARAEGVPARAIEAAFMLIIAFVIALAMKIAGVLLIISFLIIPAATARLIARSPEAMAFLSIGFGILAAIGGLYLSAVFDTPSGPAIVMAACAFFAATLAVVSAAARPLRKR